MRWLFCNKVSFANNSRPAGEEVKKKGSDRDIGENEEKEKGSEVKVQFKREPLIIYHGPD